MADALPGLGIVAAVLGVVITMAAIDGPPAEIGEKVGAALVGTFLGILLCYGFVGPLATKLEHFVDVRRALREVHQDRACSPSTRGSRRPSPSSSPGACIPGDVRPTFDETEQACKARPEKDAAAAAA